MLTTPSVNIQQRSSIAKLSTLATYRVQGPVDRVSSVLVSDARRLMGAESDAYGSHGRAEQDA